MGEVVPPPTQREMFRAQVAKRRMVLQEHNGGRCSGCHGMERVAGRRTDYVAIHLQQSVEQRSIRYDLSDILPCGFLPYMPTSNSPLVRGHPIRKFVHHEQGWVRIELLMFRTAEIGSGIFIHGLQLAQLRQRKGKARHRAHGRHRLHRAHRLRLHRQGDWRRLAEVRAANGDGQNRQF